MKSGSRFSRHLEDVEETYFEHLRHALSFALVMLWGAVCCLIHALLPFLCEKSGSRIVSRLHDRMVLNRHGLGRAQTEQDPGLTSVGSRGKRERESRESTQWA